MKICKVCNIEKELCLMVKNAKKCKDCKNSERRIKESDKKESTRFKKGQIPWNISDGLSRSGRHNKEWALNVKERDKYICQHCGIDDKSKMQAHHIVPWNDSIELRFDINNGLTLCRICHKKEDRRIHPEIIALRGRPRPLETREKLKLANLGKSPPNKGKKGQIPWNKGIPQTDEVKKKLSQALKGRRILMNPETGKRQWV